MQLQHKQLCSCWKQQWPIWPVIAVEMGCRRPPFSDSEQAAANATTPASMRGRGPPFPQEGCWCSCPRQDRSGGCRKALSLASKWAVGSRKTSETENKIMQTKLTQLLNQKENTKRLVSNNDRRKWLSPLTEHFYHRNCFIFHPLFPSDIYQGNRGDR